MHAIAIAAIAAAQTAAAAAATTPADQATPAKPTGPAFWANDEVSFTPRKGFETVLYNLLSERLGTEEELVNRLLSSGDFHRVAPRAAELRPVKPTRFLLKTWTARGVLRRTA